MKVSNDDYNNFREKTLEVHEILSRLEREIGNVPMTIRFIRSICNTISDMQQMYFEEIKGDEERAIDARIANIFVKQ